MTGAAAVVPEYKYNNSSSSPLSDSSNSMIFERNVEEPCSAPSLSYSRQGSTANLLSRQYSNRSSRASQGNLSSSPRSPLEQEYVSPSAHRRQLENCVAPALDASCSIIADDSADFNNLDVVYMRRPSTIGLDMALGRTRSNSYATFAEQQKQQRQSDDNPRTLRFYSYADVLSDEAAAAAASAETAAGVAGSGGPPVRPGLPHSASSTYIRPQTTHFSNPFVKRRDSGTGSLNLARRYSSNVLSRSPTNQSVGSVSAASPTAALAAATSRSRAARPRQQTKFQMESSGSEGFSSEEEDETPFSPQQHWGFSPLGPRVSRTSTQNSVNSSSSARARSFSSSSPSLARRRESGALNTISGLLMEDTLQTEKVGDILKKRISRREA